MMRYLVLVLALISPSLACSGVTACCCLTVGGETMNCDRCGYGGYGGGMGLGGYGGGLGGGRMGLGGYGGGLSGGRLMMLVPVQGALIGTGIGSGGGCGGGGMGGPGYGGGYATGGYAGGGYAAK